MDYSLGIDIGSVNAKLALIDGHDKVITTNTEKRIASPRTAVNSLLSRLMGKVDLGQIASVGVSGSGRGVVPKDFGWSDYSSSLAIAAIASGTNRGVSSRGSFAIGGL